jgi:hypothetical protein
MKEKEKKKEEAELKEQEKKEREDNKRKREEERKRKSDERARRAEERAKDKSKKAAQRLANRKRKCKTHRTPPQRVIITHPQAALDDQVNSHQLRRPELQMKPLRTVGAVYVS